MHPHGDGKIIEGNGTGPIDPRTFGLAKAAYTVGETLESLGIGRTSLYAAVKHGELNPGQVRHEGAAHRSA